MLTVSSRNATSAAVGSGTSGIGPGASSSVRPRYTRPNCSGMAKTNRLVSPGIGMVSAAVGFPKAAASNTRWVPRLGRNVIDESTSAAHTPVALITARAVTSRDSPVSVSVSRTDEPEAAEAATRVRIVAPCWAAVRATATTRRASSISWPS